MDELQTAIAGLAGVLGALVVAVANRLDRREARRHERRAELEAAIAGYLYTLDRLAAELAALPAAKPAPRLDRIVNRVLGAKVVHIVVFGLQRLIVGRRWTLVGDEYTAAKARLTLVAPAPLVEITAELDEHLASGQLGTTAPWREQYRAIRDRLDATVHQAVTAADPAPSRFRLAFGRRRP